MCASGSSCNTRTVRARCSSLVRISTIREFHKTVQLSTDFGTLLDLKSCCTNAPRFCFGHSVFCITERCVLTDVCAYRERRHHCSAFRSSASGGPKFEWYSCWIVKLNCSAIIWASWERGLFQCSGRADAVQAGLDQYRPRGMGAFKLWVEG